MSCGVPTLDPLPPSVQVTGRWSAGVVMVNVSTPARCQESMPCHLLLTRERMTHTPMDLATTRSPRRAQQRHDWLAILDHIDTFQQQQGISPSQRMIARALSMLAPSVVHHALHSLERQGLLRITPTQPGWPAALEITDAGRARLAAWRADRATADDGGAA